MATPPLAASAPLVLIANDQEWSARSVESILGPSGFAVLRAFTGEQALQLARSRYPDLIILDAQMTDMHGFDVCRKLREDLRIGAATPIIITTSGPSGRSQRLEAYRAGAWEFLGQPLDGEALVFKLQTFLRCKQEVDRLREEILLDPQTGLYNLRGMERRAREIGSEAMRRKDPLACVVFSPVALDGEPVGAPEVELEWVTEEVGLRFKRAGRISDAIGRTGSAEFAVLAPATGPEGALRLVRRLGSAVEASPIPGPGGDYPVRIRAGYCAVPDFSVAAFDSSELLRRATTALRDLERAGTADPVRAFDQTLH